MRQQEIIKKATQAGFGCDCQENCAYHIVVGTEDGQAVVRLPRASGAEALERFEAAAPEARSAKGQDFRYWNFLADE